MSGNFSLRRRLVLALLAVFVLGIAGTATYDRLELQEVRERLRHVSEGPETTAFQFSQMAEQDREFLGFILVPFTLAAIAVILSITHWSLRSIRRASEGAAQIDIRRLDARLDTRDLPSEIVPLVRAVNGTLDRLATAYTAEQRLTSDAAHELRTPLAVLQTRLQTAKLSGAVDWPAIEQDLAHLQRVVAQILDLARKESRQHASERRDPRPVNLARVLREAAALILPLAEQADRIIEIEAPDALWVSGSADDLRDLIRNLLENALVHGRGTIRGTLERAGENGGPARAVISVSDEGDGVPDALQEAMFERFRKLAPRSSGAGLGLAIVRHVARHHGGEASFASNATLRVVLPALDEHASR
jgi:two-component system sensor histidine kinase TctE